MPKMSSMGSTSGFLIGFEFYKGTGGRSKTGLVTSSGPAGGLC